MAYNFVVTNTKIQALSLCYRVPGEGENRPILWVYIPSKALNYNVALSDELHYKAFIEQNAFAIAQEIIIIGRRTSESTAIKVNERNAKDEVAEVRAKKNRINKSIEESAGKAELKITTTKK